VLDEGRRANKPIHELLAIVPGLGLARLPEPSAGDVFLDLEGDPFVDPGGLEFLFGYVTFDDGKEQYRHTWSLSRAEERAAFEAFVDFVMARWERHPDLHVYHYAPYEPAALKRLMGRYATREVAIDRLLRGERFVDLYAVVRHALRASVESYSIKSLEPFFDFKRSINLKDAGRHLVAVQRHLELAEPEKITEQSKDVVRDYNRDDCVAARRLRDWLEHLRTAAIEKG